MRWGVVRFPGSLDDNDALHVLRDVLGQDASLLWHKDESLNGAQCVVLPGGFSYGDYLRCGAIARFSPIMKSVARFAAEGGLVIGICNGFQILCEAHLLPGALTRNAGLRFITRDVRLTVANTRTAWTAAYEAGQELVVPLKSGEGAYAAAPATLAEIEAAGQVIVRYAGSNPNGSAAGIAGICDHARTVVGLMPHPEHAVDELTGPGRDGLGFFESVISVLAAA
jgi:phosphoribosylformylglycinamidine synthase subunit PurQ / glutaminase